METKIVLSIEEYRELTKDNMSSDERILSGMRYLQSLCGNVIRIDRFKNIRSL
jgi:hypothetical protein